MPLSIFQDSTATVSISQRCSLSEEQNRVDSISQGESDFFKNAVVAIVIIHFCQKKLVDDFGLVGKSTPFLI